jgi:hypothetical protein
MTRTQHLVLSIATFAVAGGGTRSDQVPVSQATANALRVEQARTAHATAHDERVGAECIPSERRVQRQHRFERHDLLARVLPVVARHGALKAECF